MNEIAPHERGAGVQIPEVNIADLIGVGAHFGHRKSRWNPKMLPYIFGVRNDVHIIDLRKTLFLLRRALKFVFNVTKNNGRILFVGTKGQISDIVADFAKECGQYYVNYRWVGGMLTNWKTVSASINVMHELSKKVQDEDHMSVLTKKEGSALVKRYNKLEKSISGIANMGGVPDMLFVLDTVKEKIAVSEANLLSIPVVGVVDTNADPSVVDYPIPANDDSINSISLLSSLVCQAALMGTRELVGNSEDNSSNDVAQESASKNISDSK